MARIPFLVSSQQRRSARELLAVTHASPSATAVRFTCALARFSHDAPLSCDLLLSGRTRSAPRHRWCGFPTISGVSAGRAAQCQPLRTGSHLAASRAPNVEVTRIAAAAIAASATVAAAAQVLWSAAPGLNRFWEIGMETGAGTIVATEYCTRTRRLFFIIILHV